MRDQISCFAQALRVARNRQGHQHRDAVEEPARGAHQHGRHHDHRLPRQRAEPDGLARRPQVHRRRRRDRDPDLRPHRLRGARRRVEGVSRRRSTNVLSLGPSEVGIDILALAATFDPAAVCGPRTSTPTTPAAWSTPAARPASRKASSARSSPGATLNQIQMAGMAVARRDALPHLHAALARRRGVLHSDAAARRRADRAARVRARRRSRGDREAQDHGHHARAHHDLHAAWTTPTCRSGTCRVCRRCSTAPRAMSPARLQEGIEKFGQIFFQFYGQTECGMTICGAAQGRARRRRPGAARDVWASGAVARRRGCSTTT